MSYGLRIWDENGILILDTTTRISRVLGEFALPSTPGSHTDAAISSGAFWWYMAGFTISPYITTKVPVVSLSGNTISWIWSGAAANFPSVTLVYGVY